MGQRLLVSSGSRLVREAQFVEPRFCKPKIVEFDLHGRRKIHSGAHLHGRTCTKERDMYCIRGENKSVEDKNINVCTGRGRGGNSDQTNVLLMDLELPWKSQNYRVTSFSNAVS